MWQAPAVRSALQILDCTNHFMLRSFRSPLWSKLNANRFPARTSSNGITPVLLPFDRAFLHIVAAHLLTSCSEPSSFVDNKKKRGERCPTKGIYWQSLAQAWQPSDFVSALTDWVINIVWTGWQYSSKITPHTLLGVQGLGNLATGLPARARDIPMASLCHSLIRFCPHQTWCTVISLKHHLFRLSCPH